MSSRAHRQTPVVLVASGDAGTADEVARRLRGTGAVAYATHSAEGCLRAATAIGPDVVLLDPRLPRRLDALLRAHPRSASAELIRLSEETVRHPDAAVRPVASLPPAA